MRVKSAFSAALLPANKNSVAGRADRTREVHQPPRGDAPQRVPVPQRPAAERQSCDITGGRAAGRPGQWLVRRAQRKPRVTAQAPVPADAARLTGQ
jgi:hypothetical protein